MSGFTHFDDHGSAIMVDVGAKDITERIAIARAETHMKVETLSMILENRAKKGDVLGVARLAGIMGAKKTPELIPLAHPIGLSSVNIDFITHVDESYIEIEARVKVVAQTGVEMEALTAVSCAALTIYDMCKAVDRGMVIKNIRLIEKLGGKSGHFIRQE